MQHDQQTAEWTAQLTQHQLKATIMLDAGELLEILLKAMAGMQASILCDSQLSLIEFMNHIEMIFADMGKLQAPKERYINS